MPGLTQGPYLCKAQSLLQSYSLTLELVSPNNPMSEHLQGCTDWLDKIVGGGSYVGSAGPAVKDSYRVWKGPAPMLAPEVQGGSQQHDRHRGQSDHYQHSLHCNLEWKREILQSLHPESESWWSEGLDGYQLISKCREEMLFGKNCKPDLKTGAQDIEYK